MTVQLSPTRANTNSYRVQNPTRSNAKAWARMFEARLLEPGIVSYEDQGCGKAFLSRETIAASAHTFIGRPLILTPKLKHKKVTPAMLEKEARGYITETFWGSDGWLWARGICHDDDAKDAINLVGFCSCAYEVGNVAPGAEYHAIPYDETILSFSGEHLAIVDRPRYEGATIRLNSKPTKNTMSLLKWFKKPASRSNATEVVTPAAPAAVPTAEEIAAAAAAATAASRENAAAATAASRENAAAATTPEDIDGSTELEIPTRENGKTAKVKLADLVDAYNAREDGIDMEAEIEIAGKAVKISDLVTAYNAKDDEETEEEKEKKKKAKEKENAAPAAAASGKHFRVLLNARANGLVEEGPRAAPDDIVSRCNRGKERYGSAVVTAGKN